MVVTYPSLEFKTGRERIEFDQIDQRLRFIIEDMSRWICAHGYRFIVTDVLSDAFEDEKLGRVSTSHAQGRAVDVSIKGWPVDLQDKFKRFFDAAYINHAAFSKATGKANLVVIHNNGNGPHAHIQVRPAT